MTLDAKIPVAEKINKSNVDIGLFSIFLSDDIKKKYFSLVSSSSLLYSITMDDSDTHTS